MNLPGNGSSTAYAKDRQRHGEPRGDATHSKEFLVTYVGLVVPSMTQDTMMHIAETADLEPEWIRQSFAWKQLQAGRDQGHEDERKEQAQRTLLDLLAVLFGSLPTRVRPKVKSASSRDLRTWTLRILTAPNLDAVFA